MKQKLGVFGVSIMLVCVAFGLLDYLPPVAVQLLAIVGSVTVVLGIYLVLRSMIREARVLTAYDLELQQICPTCGYDLRATPNCCPECRRNVTRAFTS